MNALRTFPCTVALVALAASLAPYASAQNYPPPLPPAGVMDITQTVYIASPDIEDRSLRRYAGQRFYNTEGADLGSVRDFIVQPATGRIRYVVVSTGGLLGGMGNELRLVPFEAVRRGTRGNLFEADILQAHWLQIPPVNDRDYVVDRFIISPTLHQEMVQRYRSAGPTPVDTTGNDLVGLIRATVLRGKSVEVGHRKVGDIENIIVDIDRGTTAALLDASADFTGTRAKYLVPLGRLAFADPRVHTISTNLTRTDFEVSQPVVFGGRDVVVIAQTPPPEPPLPPTGHVVVPVSPNPVPVSAPPVTQVPAPPPQPVVEPIVPVPVYETPAPPPQASTVTTTTVVTREPATASLPNELVQDARAIRRAIDLDPTLVAENVQVIPENGKVYLRGTVRSESTRLALETTARRVVTTRAIENQIALVRP